MSKEDNGGSAFPSGERYQTYDRMAGSYNDHSKAPLHAGMTLRDYFAAKAMQGILSNVEQFSVPGPEYVSGEAYKIADAMLKERNK